MKLVLIIIIIGFIAWFIGGVISAAILGRKKKRRAYAIVILAQLPEELTKKMINILLSHKKNDVDEVNSIVSTIGSNMLNQLLRSIGPENRLEEFSSSKFGDNLSWTAMENALQDQGYTINSSKIVTGIMLHDLDVVLMEINKKK